MPEQFEDTRVGVLMDINERLSHIESVAEETNGVKYGTGWADIREDDPQHNAAHAMGILAKYPDVWYDVLRANLMAAGSATDRRTLESIVLQVAAIATAWAADLRQRATN